MAKKKQKSEKTIPSGVYPVIDNDLARDNIENNLPVADLEELQADSLGIHHVPHFGPIR